MFCGAIKKLIIMYRILALGDSVIWGLGLRDKHKFVNKVANSLVSDGLVDDTQLISLAHAGAIIGSGTSSGYPQAVDSDPTYETEKHYIYGEIGQLYPDVFTQLRISEYRDGFTGYLEIPHDFNVAEQESRKHYTKTKLGNGWRPDLIIMDGGMNDMDPFSIMFPFNLSEFTELSADRQLDTFVDRFDSITTENNLRDIMSSAFEDRLRRLLTQTTEAYPNAKIIVTGYFPVLTENSFQGLDAAMWTLIVYNYLTLLSPSWSVSAKAAAMVTSLLTLLGKRKLIERWAMFDEVHAEMMQTAISRVNSNNVYFAKPEWGPDNGVYAPDNWLFEWELRDGLQLFSAKDPKEQARKDAFDLYASKRDGMNAIRRSTREGRTERASFAHPNATGAHAFHDAIMNVITRNRLIR